MPFPPSPPSGPDGRSPPSIPPRDLEAALVDAFEFACRLAGRAALYARMAEGEGRLNDATLLRGISESALTHAAGHIQALGATGDTDDNAEEIVEVLHEAALGGFDEAAQCARANGNEDLAEWFERVGDALILEADLLEEQLNREAGVAPVGPDGTIVEWWYPKNS